MRRLAALLALVALLTAGCAVEIVSNDSEEFGPAEQVPGIGAPSGTPPAHAWSGVVDRVIDGDTVWVDVADPNGQPVEAGEVRKLRLLRIDTPEVGRDGDPSECLADAATEVLRAMTPVGSTVYAVYDVEHQDRYGRDLVHLYTADGTWVNGAMLAAGFANVVTFPPNVAFTDEVRSAERRARELGLGLWALDACA